MMTTRACWIAIVGFCLLAPVATTVPAQTLSGVQSAVRRQVDELIEGGALTIRGANIAASPVLMAFYPQRGFELAWTSPLAVDSALRVLRDSSTHGLDPGDYHLPLLEALLAQLVRANADDELRADFDILLTDALLRMGYHLAFGKVDPERFDSQWNFWREIGDLNPVATLERMAATADVQSAIDHVAPSHPLYAGLREALGRYRRIELEGGWLEIPSGATLKPAMSDERVPMLRRRLALTGDFSGETTSRETYDAELEAAVRIFQERMGLAADGAVGPATLAELNVPVARRIEQLRVNLDRGRVLLHDLPDRFVVVNIAAYEAYLVQGGVIAWAARAQVGRPYRKTPIFRSEISYLEWNPTWTVPPGIIAKDILPAARQDPAAITRKGLRVLDGSGQELDPATVDWSRFSSGHIPYTLRQDPGPENALGRVKFMFPNEYLVYLHDTPAKANFERPDRAFSSGCVRIERPFELAKLLLNDPASWNDDTIRNVLAAGRTRTVLLRPRVPVLLAYWTSWTDSRGRVSFRRDVYGRDARWAAALSEPFRFRERPILPVARVAS